MKKYFVLITSTFFNDYFNRVEDIALALVIYASTAHNRDYLAKEFAWFYLREQNLGCFFKSDAKIYATQNQRKKNSLFSGYSTILVDKESETDFDEKFNPEFSYTTVKS